METILQRQAQLELAPVLVLVRRLLALPPLVQVLALEQELVS
jgi:hypothetical protein